MEKRTKKLLSVGRKLRARGAEVGRVRIRGEAGEVASQAGTVPGARAAQRGQAG
ncbi:hypothetical protein HMPREF0731_4550, partial [Pseudoroseomonas cervicalis ATCC 49957]